MIDVAIEVYEAFAAVMASQNQVPVQLFLCQINQESGFNPTITSPAGAVGIAQIVPKWHPGVDPLDPFAALGLCGQSDGCPLCGVQAMGSGARCIQRRRRSSAAIQRYPAVSRD